MGKNETSYDGNEIASYGFGHKRKEITHNEKAYFIDRTLERLDNEYREHIACYGKTPETQYRSLLRVLGGTHRYFVMYGFDLRKLINEQSVFFVNALYLGVLRHLSL